MELRRHIAKKSGSFGSPDLKTVNWRQKRFVIGKYSYSVKNILIVFFAVVFLVVAGNYFLAYYHNYFSNPDIIKQREINSLTLKIGRVMELPKGEQPTLATVTDKEKLKGQEFFANAKNGDKLLVYPKAKKAILYRPATEKIIEVTNLTDPNQNNSDLQQPPAAP